MYPGQGSQSVGMGRAVFDTSAHARQTFEEADAALGFSLSKLCFEQESVSNSYFILNLVGFSSSWSHSVQSQLSFSPVCKEFTITFCTMNDKDFGIATKAPQGFFKQTGSAM